LPELHTLADTESVFNATRIELEMMISKETTRLQLSPRELTLGLVVLCLLGLALFGPSLAQPGAYHQFANQSTWFGIHNASDVLSNLPFGIAGIWGFWVLHQSLAQIIQPTATEQVRNICIAVFFCGLLATSVGSSWYHLQPDHTGLAVDRLTMAIAFAGLLGVAACERISARSSMALMMFTVLAGPLSLWHSTLTGNILPWAVVQFGGLAILIGLSFVKTQASAVSLPWIVAIYALAKFFEHFDVQVFELTGHLVSGHTLKHLVASLVIFVVVNALARSAQSAQSRS
jgi:hypothetical protein